MEKPKPLSISIRVSQKYNLKGVVVLWWQKFLSNRSLEANLTLCGFSDWYIPSTTSDYSLSKARLLQKNLSFYSSILMSQFRLSYPMALTGLFSSPPWNQLNLIFDTYLLQCCCSSEAQQKSDRMFHRGLSPVFQKFTGGIEHCSVY